MLIARCLLYLATLVKKKNLYDPVNRKHTTDHILKVEMVNIFLSCM